MAGENDLEQLNTIFRALGTPTEDEWPVSPLLPSSLPSFPPSFWSCCVLTKDVARRDIENYQNS